MSGERPSHQTQFNASASQKPTKRKRPSPVSVRFSEAELDRLKAEAGARSLNGHIRYRLFGSETKTRRGPTSAQPDKLLLSKLLRSLGDWDLTWALKELELAVDEGVILLDAGTCRALRNACADITAMRHDLTRALGLRSQSHS